MDLLISIGLLVVGIIIGFFAAKYLYVEKEAEASNKATAADVKAVMTQQAEHHVFQAKQSLNSIQQQIEALSDHLQDYESQLQPQEEDNSTPKMSFFGEQTTAMLRNNTSLRKRREKRADEEQPRDFANSSSGLFVDEKVPSTDSKA
jgi:uncharacterized membrane-anchored protein YhcB (DUF1043 family)